MKFSSDVVLRGFTVASKFLQGLKELAARGQRLAAPLRLRASPTAGFSFASIALKFPVPHQWTSSRPLT